MPNVLAQRVTTVSLSLQNTLLPQLEAVSYNLANVMTSGFKEVLPSSVEAAQGAPGQQSVSYAKPAIPTRDFRDGAYRNTENPLDIAISGTGFFMLSNNHLTRNGQFQLNKEGKIVTPSGEALMGDGGEIVIPTNAKYVKINQDGTITTDKGKIGKVGIYSVSDLKNITYASDGNFIAPDELTLVDKPIVLQGFVEDSNVNPVEQTIKLIEIMRLFEQAQKIIDAQSKRISQVMNVSSRNVG